MSIFWKCLAAYLTGWVIAQTFYNRVIRHAYRENADEWARRQASETADELERRRLIKQQEERAVT